MIDRSLAAPGLLAWVVIQKYLDHLPLYRIEQINSRHGVAIARSTLAEILKQGQVLHADETPVPQLDPSKGKTKRASLWEYRSNTLEDQPAIIVFDFQTGRSGSHAQAFLGVWPPMSN